MFGVYKTNVEPDVIPAAVAAAAAAAAAPAAEVECAEVGRLGLDVGLAQEEGEAGAEQHQADASGDVVDLGQLAEPGMQRAQQQALPTRWRADCSRLRLACLAQVHRACTMKNALLWAGR